MRPAGEGKERQQGAVIEDLPKRRLENVGLFVDLGAIGTSLISVSLVLVVNPWFVLSQLRHYCLLYVIDPRH